MARRASGPHIGRPDGGACLIDEIIELIKRAPDTETARNELCARAWPASEVEAFIRLIDDPGHEVIDGHYKLSETQARAILDLRLQRLTGMEREKLAEETGELAGRISDYLEILGSQSRVDEVVLEEPRPPASACPTIRAAPRFRTSWPTRMMRI